MGIDIFLFIDLQNIHFIKIEYTLYKNIQKNICTHFTDLVISLSLFIHLQNVHFIKIEYTEKHLHTLYRFGYRYLFIY